MAAVVAPGADEACSQWKDDRQRNVDWVGRGVRFDPHTTKNGEARSFPFTTDIEKVLKE